MKLVTASYLIVIFDHFHILFMHIIPHNIDYDIPHNKILFKILR